MSNWKKEGNTFTLQVEVPVNTQAIVYVPASSTAVIKEGKTLASQAKGVKSLGHENGYARFEVGSGQYLFKVE